MLASQSLALAVRSVVGVSRRFHARRRASIAMLIITFALPTSAVRAIPLYWDNNGSGLGSGGPTPNGNWFNGGTTWSTSSAGTVATGSLSTGPNDDLTFAAGTDATGSYAVTVVGTEQARGIVFEDGTVTLSSGIINLNVGGGFLVTSTATGTETVNSNVTLGTNAGAEAFTFANNSSTETLSIGAMTGSQPGQKTITVNGSGTTSLNGIIGASTAVINFVLNGGGTLNLNGANTFNGTTTLTTGTLTLGNATALGGSGATFTIGGGTLNSTVANLVISNNNLLTINGNFAFTGTNSLNLGTGDVSLGSGSGANRQITVNANTLTLAGAISNGTIGNAITKAGAGTLSLTGSGTYTGGTTVNGGTVIVQSGNGLINQGSLNVGTSGVSGQSGTFTIDGPSNFDQNVGSGAAAVTIGTAATTTGVLNIGTTVNGAALFTGTGGMTINPTGTVNVGFGAVGGELIVDGNLTVDHGTLQTAFFGVVSIPASSTMTVEDGGHATFADGLFFNSTYVIRDPGSQLAVNSYSVIGNGATVQVILGATLAQLDVNNRIDLSAGPIVGGATLIVDGAGSSVVCAGNITGTQSLWGQSGTVNVTLSHAATASFPGGIRMVTGTSNATVTASIQTGASLNVGNLDIDVVNGTTSAVLTVTDLGSSVALTPGSVLTIGATIGSATLSVNNSGTLTVGSGGSTTLNPTGVININGGGVDLKTITDNGGAFNFTAGSLSYIGGLTATTAGLTINGAGGSSGLLMSSTTLDGTKTLNVSGTTTINPLASLTLSGGTLITSILANNGTFNSTSGTLGITGAGGLTIGSGSPLANNYSLPVGTNLNVTNATTLNSGASLDVNGGAFSSGAVNNAGSLTLDAGSLAISGALANNAGGFVYIGQNKVATVGGVSTNAGEIQLGGATALLTGAGTLANTGLIRGDGVITNNVTNNFGGEIRGESGKRIKFTGVNGSNGGKINLQGGTAEFSQALTNTGNGLIAGRGTLIVGGTGLLNQANVALSAGITDIFGKVNNSTGVGTKGITVSGNANVTFWNDVTNGAGSLLKVSTGSSATFFGTFGGAGVSGGGQVNMEADVTPGFSPAAVTFGGNLAFDSTSTLHLDLGGTIPGNGPNNHDQVNVVGAASLAGGLDLVPYNGFVPVSGDKFVVMTYATASGSFSSVTGTNPAPGLTYVPVYSPTSLVILTTTNGDKTWGVDASGNSSLGANWLGGVAPGGIGDTATFSTIITAPRTVTVDADTTVGGLKFDSPNNYTIAGPHTLTLQAAGAAAATINDSGVHGNGAHTVSAPITLASDLAIVQNSGGTLRLTGPLNDSSAHALTKSGSGTAEISGPPTLGAGSTVVVSAGTLRFALTSGATVGAGVQAAVNGSATLELAGTASALSSGVHRANIVNNSAAPAGLLASGTNQQVGFINGAGNTQVNAGSDLTANHIIQTSLVIGGTAGSPSLVTIAASDGAGNPLGQSNGPVLSGSLAPSDPIGAGGISSADLRSGGGSELASLSRVSSVGNGNPSAVPEPSTLLLALLAVLGVFSTRFARHHLRWQTV
jgi:fibronectin-binding autotransporter adhesin